MHQFETKCDPTGLVHLRARSYDPELGRFLSHDPWPGQMVDPLTLNRYAYVLNNPASYTDPTGMRPQGSTNWEEAVKSFLTGVLVPCSYAALQLVEEAGLILGGAAAIVAPEPALTKALGAGALTAAAYNYEHYSQSVSWCLRLRADPPTAPTVPFELP